jgi:acylphosphatase
LFAQSRSGADYIKGTTRDKQTAEGVIDAASDWQLPAGSIKSLQHGIRRTGLMAEPQMVRRIVVHGHVQRVRYRLWTAETARARGLDGWVRNRADGTVEAVFAGDTDAVAAMVDACCEGPPKARVETIDQHAATVDDLARRQAGEGFSVLPTE